MTSEPARLALDFDEIRDVTVIGAGPVGMCTAFSVSSRAAAIAWVVAPILPSTATGAVSSRMPGGCTNAKS